jgi:hypothetical protein
MRNRLTIGMIIGVVLGILLTSTVVALGGSLDSSAPPASTSSYTLNDIYNRLHAGTTGSPSTFTEPDSGPGSTTMYTLNDIMAAAPVADATNAATAADVISGETFWGLGAGGAWGLQTGSFSVVGQRATVSSVPGISKILDGMNSDETPDNPDTELADVSQLLNPNSSDTIPNIIGVPSGYRYTTDGGATVITANVPYPVSISTLIGTPSYDPYTGLPLLASNTYNPAWISYNSASGYYYFNLTAPIALRLRSVMSQLVSQSAMLMTP